MVHISESHVISCSITDRLDPPLCSRTRNLADVKWDSNPRQRLACNLQSRFTWKLHHCI